MGPCANLMLTLGGRPDRDEGTSRQDLGAAAGSSDHAQGSQFYSNQVLGLASPVLNEVGDEGHGQVINYSAT